MELAKSIVLARLLAGVTRLLLSPILTFSPFICGAQDLNSRAVATLEALSFSNIS